MSNINENRSSEEDWRHQLASAFGVDVQRPLVFFSLYENALVQGALPSSVKHLIALAMAIGERARENIAHHVREALRAGASRDEVKEAVTVAVLIAGIPSLLSGVEALTAMAQYQAQELLSSSSSPLNGTHG